MRRALAITMALTALTGLPGCRVFEKLTKERSPAEPTSRTKEKDWLRERQNKEPDGPPKDWLSGPPPAGRGDRVPPADRSADPASRGFDARAASQRTLSGIIEDSDGRPLPNAYITVENADPVKAGYGAPMGVESDREGYFEINGLNSGEHYMLAAQVRGGKPQAGRISVQVPNTRIRLRLKDDYQLPPGRASGDLPPTENVPPPPKQNSNDNLPPAAVTPPAKDDWSPLGPNGTKPTDSPTPSRGDLVAPGSPPDWRTTMPPANIPGPTVPGIPSPTAPTVPPLVPGPTSKSTTRGGSVSLLDATGRPREVLSGRADDLILLDFLTSNCLPCKKAIPALVSFHDRQRKVEVIGVLCDRGSDDSRIDAANRYRKDNRLPYEVFAESKSRPLQDQFQIDGYPTLVLLDGTGKRLWTGHPKDLNEIERIIRNR